MKKTIVVILNQRCFIKKKTITLNFQPAQYEKNKFDKDNFGKQIDKKTCGETL
jgi:hypothetical protein